MWAPAEFFVVRTPLLAFDELLGWGQGLLASGALADPLELAKALDQDRTLLRGRLREIGARADIREALFVSSPHLVEALDGWLREPDGKRAEGIERALLRYFTRMASRSTPFGLCAGFSVGRVGEVTRLCIEGREKYRRRTRLAMDYLFALTEAVRSDPKLRHVFRYRPNSSLYRFGGDIRCVASRLKDGALSYHLLFAEESDHLADTLARAAENGAFESLAGALVNEEVTITEAEAYVAELIDSQILVADVPLVVTGPEPIDALIERFGQHPLTQGIAEQLRAVAAELAAIDQAPLGVERARYRAALEPLEGLPAKADPAHLLRVDLVKPAPEAILSNAVVAEILRGAELVHRVGNARAKDELTRFRERFQQRYEQREAPLLEALDEEDGVGFFPATDVTPLLEGIDWPVAEEETQPWTDREKFLLRKLGEARQSGAQELMLTPKDIALLSTQEPQPLPDSFAVKATLAAASERAVARGEFQVILDYVSGPSGARMLGRFCGADETLRQRVEKHLRAEEALRPDAIFAEIVHLPEAGAGFLCRPALREYEIPYLGDASVPPNKQIPVTDLMVSVREGRIVLRSKRLGREIIPRLTASHNLDRSSVGVYRFLSMLQGQDVAWYAQWNWGALEDSDFLPSVRCGRVILRCAQWRIAKDELQELGKHTGAALYQTVQAWRARRRLPRWVAVADHDNILPIDLDNVLGVEMLVHLVGQRDSVVLEEVIPAPGELCVHGPEGRFTHELIVPFVRKAPAAREEETFRDETALSLPAVIRTFPPGSEWLYAKFYAGSTTVDRVLLETVSPLIRDVMASGAADQWFFIRYADPEHHLRLRFHGEPGRLLTEVLPAIASAAAPLIEDERLWRWQLDTYEREVERYAGPVGILLAERLFQADSEAVLAIMALLDEGDAGLDERWRLALRGMDALMDDFGLDLEAKSRIFVPARQSLAKTAPGATSLKDQVSEKFRRERAGLEELLDRERDGESPLRLGFDVLAKRSQALAPIVAEWNAAERSGRMLISRESFVRSCVHMYANRLFRSAQVQQEGVIYDFLTRIYRSRLARKPS
jgi:thiopeptide-type bacteriocin biosynthesis protein